MEWKRLSCMNYYFRVVRINACMFRNKLYSNFFYWRVKALYVEYGERVSVFLVDSLEPTNNVSCVLPFVKFHFLTLANIDFIQYWFANSSSSFLAVFISLVVGWLTKFSLLALKVIKQLLVSLISILSNI